MALLEVDNLSVSYRTAQGKIPVVRDFSLGLEPGESLALVGESGSGKSTVALSLLGLLDRNAIVERGTVRFQGVSLLDLDGHAWRRVRGTQIGMVFQDARGALNPVLTVGSQLVEAILSHQRVSRRAAKEQALALFAEVGFAEPAFTFGRYPGELSGGMCQRAAIAAAICNRPKLLIADEPTSALDPGIQAQIMQVLGAMKQQHGLALILISHDLALVSEAAERIAVMYHGRMVESGEAGAVLHAPAHPYTGALLACLPDLNRCWDRDPLESIPGAPPSRLREHPGCAFSERCSQSGPDCSATQPAPVAVADGHWAACLRPSFPPAAKF